MKAIILAAGRGVRMLPLTKTIPKTMVPVAGKPILRHILEAFPRKVDEVIIVIGYKGEKIRRAFGRMWHGKSIRYVEQKKLNGTAGALLCARHLIAHGERFIIIYGDEIPTRGEMKTLLSHESAWLCHKVDDPRQSGVPTITPAGRITSVVEKPKRPKSLYAVGGALVVTADIFSFRSVLHKNGEYYLSSMMNRYLRCHNVTAVRGRTNLFFSTPTDVDRFNKNQYSRRHTAR
ncbi:MAG: hypothetical protein A3I44_03665 [Candidatus Sungbacteria bacterium RIFCSPLOWO2_02_FULL_51_17]|uniref:Nucleotidyl transferase domain-containing protein n=1 Tax=Candidatus Sungbacteria bacterium RIFCSPHIGHO2_02_FULL_51_29 TaxID=1802273 RepID=A0A1G2KQZ9_9BACT|nr:MAG: hypothetical protein A2676_03445 [Candidatus Sungbacteria bacterium RIFCSPHIGHO2_01_FULL_51_22]OHA01810.1 MAG: hypothetical protein A3C16_05850 [Candidatus Sungbacteria bacterium RIFCSPHIGHO2_02_FULL_51_29]OHA07195.1 MAG: hypothetical protein A3B29_00450 [Candidatus Sungbacteria bacterium RIFCSPLOWO2_01_FULL_51_34]OHA10485.1 MAG: hypothetical protein A3I44_03665 [Candidatus Sungbacteria bacterium RIFCSPLOWO2_02_FULL_51_17]